MQALSQSPTDPAFVQDPYPFYHRARAAGDLFLWEDYGQLAAAGYAQVKRLLKDRRLGREMPAGLAPPVPERLQPFYDVEAHSMLELDPPRHTRLRGLVLRAFTSATVEAQRPAIEALCTDLIARFPSGPFDLLEAFCRPLPVITIATLLGVDTARAPDLLAWSNAMVGMYQAGRTRAMEEAAIAATQAFTAFLAEEITRRRASPSDDLISQLIAAEAEGEKLTANELTSTVILLLNAGHEATVHSLGNGVKLICEHELAAHASSAENAPLLTEEILRHAPPLHIFERIAREDFEIYGHHLKRGQRISCLLAGANRDPDAYPDPDSFNPTRRGPSNMAFGAGLHFCVGAPLARLELQIALPALFTACPGLSLAELPLYAPVYHFHGLEKLIVTA
ncbi:cytochrome P450 [Vannielia litorea]|uniref:cytochrome P450 n=1 Tax=Vannielia litorea TaxID=1217970 RepID=UPI001C94389F|nr:cytochrome P450 [Vannielia litorea]MBY6047691.1 cytochrome P450 [Vannielia litorea]MBY6075105.1 cytochrome P450 [Vannielia litorea]